MATASNLKFYLLPQPQTTVFTGRVASAPSDPYINIAYNTGVTGSFGAPLPGQSVWFGSTSGGKERGVRRLRSWPGGAAGTLVIDESDDTGPLIQANDYITIKWDMRLWPKFPRFVQSGLNVTTYEDYDVAYSNQTSQWYPTAVAGPPGFAELSGGTAQLNFVGDRSRALAPGASISSYLWKAWSSAEGTSTSQGTEASPVTFTWSAPGWHLVSLTVADSNGNSHTAYTWAIVLDPADPEAVAFIDFDAASDNYDFEQGGGACSFAVRGTNADTTVFPAEGMVVHACSGNLTTPTGSWPFRTNILFWGYVTQDGARQNPDTGEVSFQAATIDAIMRNLSVFPPSLTSTTTPTEWTQGSQLTAARVLSYMYKWRSTLDTIAPVIFPTYSGLIARQDFGKDKLYDRVQGELMRSIWGKVVSSHQGVLYHEIDYNLQNAAERAAATTRKTLHKGIWANDVFIEERSNYQWPANQVEMSGIAYTGGNIEDICPLFSRAPGDVPKAYGNQLVYDRLILLSQDDLNVRTGHGLAKANQQYPTYRMQFVNDGAFTVAPQELYPANIEAADNNRGIAYSGNLIPRRMSRRYSHEGGFFIVNVDFEPETSGQPGVTVEVDCGPPTQTLPTLPGPPLAAGGPVALIAGTTGTSAYYAPGLAQSWQRRVSGLADPEQLGFLDLIPDPWSTFKQGYSPEKVIVWGSGRGFLVRSVDSAKSWKDRTSYLDAPAWAGETGSAIENVDLMEMQASIFSEDRLYLLARWQSAGLYHGAIGKSDDGFDFTWHNITGSAQVRPLGLSLDKGNGGTLYVTTWENEPTGTLYLRAYNAETMALARRVSLGAASSSQVDTQSYYAHPFNRLGGANEVYVFGRMDRPQSFTGTVHALKNTGAGATGSYSVVENTWSTDVCMAFGADEDSNLYAVRGAPVSGGAIMAYQAVTTEYGTAVLLGTGPASIGTPAVFSTETIDQTAIAGLSATQAIVFYRNTFASFAGRACLLNISGGIITPETPIFPGDSGIVQGLSICALSATQALIVHSLSASGLRAMVLDVSGSTITPGTSVEIDASTGAGSSANWVSVARLSATKAIVVYADAGSNNAGEAAILDISGSTITPGAVYTFQAGSLSDFVTNVGVTALSSTQAVVAYNHTTATAIDQAAKVLDVSGTVITPGAINTAFSGSSGSTPGQGSKIIDTIDSSTFVIIAANRTPSNIVRGIVGTVAASVISYGAAQTLTGALGATTMRPGCVIPVAGTAIYVYRDNAVIYVATVGLSGTTVTDNNDDATSFSGDYPSVGLLETI